MRERHDYVAGIKEKVGVPADTAALLLWSTEQAHHCVECRGGDVRRFECRDHISICTERTGFSTG